MAIGCQVVVFLARITQGGGGAGLAVTALAGAATQTSQALELTGQATHLSPPYPAHYMLHGAGRYGLQCLANLDQLPPKGALLICPPLKVQDGSGSPLRVLALVPA